MGCRLKQIACVTGPVSSTDVCVKEADGTVLEARMSYSEDSVTWSDWMTAERLSYFVLKPDNEWFLRLQVYGNPSCITVGGQEVDFKLSLSPSFDFDAAPSESLYDPYANLDCARKLYQQLSDNVANMIGIPCLYFKVSPDTDAKDVTFKEYCHLAVKDMKYLKIVVADGSMPSSKPDLENFGISWNVDWDTEISKSHFAAAFGNKEQPMEGDLVYIPMMQRMWQVVSAYEEKKDGFMWNAATFHVFLRKYESQDAISTEGYDAMIQSVVKNTYESLFGETVQGSETDTLSAPIEAEPLMNGYQIWDRDAYRKEISVPDVKITENPIYHKGMLVADNWYAGETRVVYQKKYCGDTGTLCFCIEDKGGSGEIFEFGSGTVIKKVHDIFFGDIKLTLEPGTWYVWIRWSRGMGIVEAGAARHAAPENVPAYRMRPSLFRFDFENSVRGNCRFSEENIAACKENVVFGGNASDLFSAIKLYTEFREIPETLQQYPNDESLLINDTVRKLSDLPGYPFQNNSFV